jgi:mortality factor 4-like protein 1
LDQFHEEYLKTSNATRSSTPLLEDSMKEVVEGLKLYFEKAVGNILLYKFERRQYVEILNQNPDTSLCDLYGAEHLLRLFGMCN